MVDESENKKAYDISQKARAMERAIRKTKKLLLMKETEMRFLEETDVRDIMQGDYDKLAYKLREQNKKYNEFLSENSMKKEYDRTKTSGFDRKRSARANGAATRYQNRST